LKRLIMQSPLQYALGETGRSLGARAICGPTVFDAGGELCWQVACTQRAAGGGRHWTVTEPGGMEGAIGVERFDAFDAAVVRFRLKNASGSPRTLRFVQYRLDFDHGGHRWKLMTCGGGMPIGTYPTAAYDVREVAFLSDAQTQIGSPAGGRSSDKDLPLVMCARADIGQGFWYGMEWSGEWYMSASAHLKSGLFRADAGVPVHRLVLQPGEELVLPPLCVGTFTGGFAGGTNALRRYLYQQHSPDYLGERPYPRVSYDHWFGVENEFTEASLRRQIDRATDIGIESWCLDAGWFGTFETRRGDWHQADPAKFPDGIEPLARHARERGLSFGLWFEGEHAQAGTWAVREYPELFWPDPRGGGSHHLNLTRRDAQDWLIELISGWITRLDLRWSRFDYNIDPASYWHAADPTNKVQFAYVAGLYRVLDELRRRHPQWMIENCASGGRRIDMGTLRRCHTNWFNDFTTAPHTCRWMQLRSQRFLSGNHPNSSVAIGRGRGDPADIDLEVLSRFCGKLSFDGDIASLSAAATARCRYWTDLYKRHRHLLVGDFHQLSPIPRDDKGWDVVQFGNDDLGEHLVASYRVGGDDTWREKLCVGSEIYHATELVLGRAEDHTGASLGENGLTFEQPPNSARLFHLSRM
jgi:alpha-galactosidase